MKARELVDAHPLLATGGAFAAGALVGFAMGKPGRIAGAIIASASGIAMAVIRELVMREVKNYARSWIDETGPIASSEPGIERFFEH